MIDDYGRADAAESAVLAARAQLSHAEANLPRNEPEMLVLAAHLADETYGHNWPVMPLEAVNPEALRAMHTAAHLALVHDYLDESLRLTAERSGKPFTDAPAEEFTVDRADPLYPSLAEFCYRQFSTCCDPMRVVTPGSGVTLSVLCAHGLGHFPYTDHSAPHPWRPGRWVRWDDRELRILDTDQ